MRQGQTEHIKLWLPEDMIYSLIQDVNVRFINKDKEAVLTIPKEEIGVMNPYLELTVSSETTMELQKGLLEMQVDVRYISDDIVFKNIPIINWETIR